MERAEVLLQYKQHLMTMINLINKTIPLQEKDQVLIVYQLNTIEKIRKFFAWLKERSHGETLQATDTEIVRAAVKIGKGEM